MRRNIGAVEAASMLLAGIFIGSKFHVSLLLCCLLFGAGLAGGIFFYLRGKEFVLDQLPVKLSRLFFCLAIFSFGMGRTALSFTEQPADRAERFAGQYVKGLKGFITAPPVTTASRTTLRVQLEKEQPDPVYPDEGKLLLVFFQDPKIDFRYGDRLSIDGTPVLPTDTGGGFSFRSYLEREGIIFQINNPDVKIRSGFSGSRIRAVIFRLRQNLVNRVCQLFPKPESALMAGILLGDESGITADVSRDFQKTGTAHIIAISGANFTLLLWVLLTIVRRIIPRWWSPLLVLPFIYVYTILVGGNSAVVRAAVMCALSIFGSVIGRTGYGVNNLALTAAAMCLWKPATMFDLGFQLSAMATLGILLFSGPLCNWARGILSRIFPKMSEDALTSAVNLLNDLCLMSVSAQVFTVWICAQAFGRISLISLPANFLIAPFQSMIMLGGFASLLLSYLFYPLGAAAAWLVWTAPALTIRIVKICAAVKWGSIYSDISSFQAWLICGIILAAWFGRSSIAGSIRKRRYQPYAAALLLFAAVMIWVNTADRLIHRTEIGFHQTSSAMTLRILSPEGRLFIIGDGLTNYAAQDALAKQFIPLRRVPEAACIDIPEYWMRREFLGSGAADDLPVFYLNGESRRSGAEIPEKLSTGTVFSFNDLELQIAGGFLGRRAWLVESGGIRLLFPNGVPPERIFVRNGIDPEKISLLILGKRDDPVRWNTYRTEHAEQLPVFDRTDSIDTSFYLSENGLSYR